MAVALLKATHSDIIDITERRKMAQLIVRNIDEELVKLLRIRAARRGSSAEAEHREILREALQPNSKGKSIKALLLEMPDAGEDEDFLIPRDMARKVEI
jgi:plasmid stability protein